MSFIWKGRSPFKLIGLPAVNGLCLITLNKVTAEGCLTLLFYFSLLNRLDYALLNASPIVLDRDVKKLGSPFLGLLFL